MSRGSAVAQFTEELPSTGSYWRAIILFGRNVASYKFALGSALLEVGQESEVVSLEELALPFATRVAAHLRTNDKQGTSGQSRFLDACRAFNRSELDEDGLRKATVQLGFVNVLDAFHVVDNAETPQRFFVDERRSNGSIRVTDHLAALGTTTALQDLDAEIEARWRLVETAWALNLPRTLLTVEFDQSNSTLVVPRRRTAITGARGALNGYQKGSCFYCFGPISIASGQADTCEVDHVFAWSVGAEVGGAPSDGVWNLVLACKRCNGWHEKGSRPPATRYVERLHRRNEFLISSHHPLRPTLIAQTGSSDTERAATLRRAHDDVSASGARNPWVAPDEGPPIF